MRDREIRVLVLCTYESTYVIQLFHYVRLYHNNIKFSLFTQDSLKPFYEKHLVIGEAEAIYSFGDHEYSCWLAARALPQFDIIHSLWMEHFWGESALILRSKCSAWFCSVGGSDLYKESKNRFWRMLQKRIIRRSAWLSSEGEDTRDFFKKTYGSRFDKIPHTIIRFGVDTLDSIDVIGRHSIQDLKDKYGVPREKVVIMCGTNARSEQQHLNVIEAIQKLPSNIREQCCLFVPMTYGGTAEYIGMVKERVSGFVNCVVVEDYLSTQEMAEIALITDILIHVQTTDQLSSIMMSHFYCGNVVIAGAWLPYQELRDKGMSFVSVDEIAEITDELIGLIPDIEMNKRRNSLNTSIVKGMSSWEHSANEWYNVYQNLAKKGAE